MSSYRPFRAISADRRSHGEDTRDELDKSQRPVGHCLLSAVLVAALGCAGLTRNSVSRCLARLAAGRSDTMSPTGAMPRGVTRPHAGARHVCRCSAVPAAPSIRQGHRARSSDWTGNETRPDPTITLRHPMAAIGRRRDAVRPSIQPTKRPPSRHPATHTGLRGGPPSAYPPATPSRQRRHEPPSPTTISGSPHPI